MHCTPNGVPDEMEARKKPVRWRTLRDWQSALWLPAGTLSGCIGLVGAIHGGIATLRYASLRSTSGYGLRTLAGSGTPGAR
jgi:hypothetical protein